MKLTDETPPGKPGRKPGSRNKTHNPNVRLEVVRVRLSAVEHEAVLRYANDAGKTVSEYIRGNIVKRRK